jgi:hyaluronan synthase
MRISVKVLLPKFLILGILGTIFAAKVYFLLYINFFVGIYSLLTTSLLLSIFLISYFKFKDPYHYAKDIPFSRNMPLVSIIVPVKNEEGNIRNCVQSCINSTYPKKEIIIVNDGSTDKTQEILQKMQQEYESEIKVIHLSKNVGKKQAIEHATNIADGEIYAFMDSDCDMASNAVENALKVFESRPMLGALTAYGRVRNAHKGNRLEKIQDTWFDGQYRLIKGMESSYFSVTCCSGALSFFRREAIQPFIHEWAHDEFLGIKDFKFATDRRLTAYVLGTKKHASTSMTYLQNTYNNHKILQTARSDPPGMYNDDGKYWDVMYSRAIIVNMGVPETFTKLVRQQIRWRKSFIRSCSSTSRIYWKRPLPIAIIYYLQLILKLIRPFIILKALVLLPLSGDYFTGALYVTGILFTGMVYAIDFRIHNRDSRLWKYRPLMVLFSSFVYVWLLLYAVITIRKTTWR